MHSFIHSFIAFFGLDIWCGDIKAWFSVSVTWHLTLAMNRLWGSSSLTFSTKFVFVVFWEKILWLLLGSQKDSRNLLKCSEYVVVAGMIPWSCYLVKVVFLSISHGPIEVGNVRKK